MRTFGRIAVILLLVAIIGGVGYGVWNSGYDQGVVDAADSTTQIVVREGHRGGFFPFGAIFGFFFLLLIFKSRSDGDDGAAATTTAGFRAATGLTWKIACHTGMTKLLATSAPAAPRPTQKARSRNARAG